MTDQSHRFANRVPDTDWAEVLSWPDGRSLAVGHLKDVSEGGLSLDLPVCLVPASKVSVKLSSMSNDVLRQFQFTGTVVHAEVSGQGCVHGIKFDPMTQTEHTTLTDYLCQVEYHHRLAS